MMTQPITIEALEVLDAIDRKGSFAAAANILYRVPSAVSYTVQKLEQDLGVSLFVKQGRKSVLTPAGKLLLEQGREILQATSRLAEAARQLDSGWESSINICIDSALGIEHIYPVLEEFFVIKPDIEINLHQEVLAGSWEALLENRADIAMGLPTKPGHATDIFCEPYCDVDWVFAVHHGHPLAQVNQPISKEDTECYRAVVVRDSAKSHATITHRVFSKQPVLRVPSVPDKIAAQKAGLGIGYLPKNKIEQELLSGELVALDIEGVENVSSLYIAWHRGAKGKALRWFIDRLKQKM